MTAHEQYLERRKGIEEAIKMLKKNLADMDANETQDKTNWGYAGNCGNILGYLADVNHFMEV